MIGILKDFIKYAKSVDTLHLIHLIKYADIVYEIRKRDELRDFVRESEVFDSAINRAGERLRAEGISAIREGRWNDLRNALKAVGRVGRRKVQGNILMEVI